MDPTAARNTKRSGKVTVSVTPNSGTLRTTNSRPDRRPPWAGAALSARTDPAKLESGAKAPKHGPTDSDSRPGWVPGHLLTGTRP